jgi:LPS-assembly lipoprotein
MRMTFVSRTMIAGALALGLAGCFRPLYGSAEFNGLNAQAGLAGVAIDIQGDRLAHYLRNELEFGLRGGNPVAGPTNRYTLTITPSSRTGGAIVDRVAGVAESAALFIDAQFVLREQGRSAALTEGTANVVVSYERSLQRFANTRAARDAEIQGARQLAEQIRGRIASFIATR